MKWLVEGRFLVSQTFIYNIIISVENCPNSSLGEVAGSSWFSVNVPGFSTERPSSCETFHSQTN